MADFVLLTDDASDMPEGQAAALGVRVLTFSMCEDGKEPIMSDALSAEELYEALRAGKMFRTASISIGGYFDIFNSYAEEGKDVLYLCFSSGLSSTYNNARMAAEECAEKYPERQIIAFDSLCASGGLGYLVALAAKKRDEGLDARATAAYLDSIKLRICHQFTVDDLFFLKRGGRISAATAIIGTVLQFKPVLHMDNDGRLSALGKVRGRKAALAWLSDKTAETLIPDETPFIFINHGSCRADAETLAAMIKERFGYDAMIFDIGAAVGAHSGPGTLAIYYIGTER